MRWLGTSLYFPFPFGKLITKPEDIRTHLQFQSVVSFLHLGCVPLRVGIPCPHQLLVTVIEEPQLAAIGVLIEEVAHEVGIDTHVGATVLR